MSRHLWRPKEPRHSDTEANCYSIKSKNETSAQITMVCVRHPDGMLWPGGLVMLAKLTHDLRTLDS